MALDPLSCRASPRPLQWTGAPRAHRAGHRILVACTSMCACALHVHMSVCACKHIHLVSELQPVSCTYCPSSLHPEPQWLPKAQAPHSLPVTTWLAQPSLGLSQKPGFLPGPVLLSHFLCRCLAVCVSATVVHLWRLLCMVSLGQMWDCESKKKPSSHWFEQKRNLTTLVMEKPRAGPASGASVVEIHVHLRALLPFGLLHLPQAQQVSSGSHSPAP